MLLSVSLANPNLIFELRHVLKHTDCTCHAASRMENQVLTVVSSQKLHVLGHSDRTNKVDEKKENVGGAHWPKDNNKGGQCLNSK